MKHSFIYLTILLAAFWAFVACNHEEITPETNNESLGTIDLLINAGSPETRTIFGTNTGSGYPITWSETGEVIELVEILTPDDQEVEASSKHYSSSEYTLSNGNAKAMFSTTINELNTEGTYDYRAIYPSSVFQSVNLQFSDIYVKIPDSQTPTADSPDAAATILYAASTGHPAQPTSSLDLAFSHVTAYGKMTIKNASDAFTNSSETISSVSISVPAGGIYYYWGNGSISPVSATKKDAVTIKTDNINTTGDFDVWFSCSPYELEVDDVLTVSVTTEANTYTRSITMTKAMSFESGKVSKFSVDMSTANAADDLSGDYLIASTDGTNPWYLMTYEVSNNVYLGAITNVSASTKLDANVLSDFCSNIYVWTLEKVSGGYTLKNAYTGKYATVDSDNNYGHASTSPVTLTVSDNGEGVFTVTAQNFPSRNLQFNYNSGNTRFAFYGSSQKALHFIPVTSYKTALDKPTVSASASGSTISVSWNAVENASSYTVTCGEDQKSVSGTNTEFTNLSDGQYTVTVTAIGSGTYASSLPASASVVVSTVTGTEVVFVVGSDFNTLEAINNGVTIDGITLKCNTTAYYSPLRIYKNNTVSLNSTSGKSIVKVVFTGFSNDYIRTWSASDGGTCAISGSTMTWTNSGASSIIFTQTHNSQARITKFTVTYKEATN